MAVNLHFLDNPGTSGIFNCGTGRAQPFNDVAAAVVNTLRAERGEAGLSLAQLVELDLIRYIPFPDDLGTLSELYPGRCVAPACRRFHRAHARRADGRGRVRALLARPQVSRCRMPALPGRNKPPPCLVMPAVFVGSRSIPGTRICRRGCFRSPPRRQLPAIAMICGWRDNRRVRFLSGDPHACIRCSIQRLVPAGRHSSILRQASGRRPAPRPPSGHQADAAPHLPDARLAKAPRPVRCPCRAGPGARHGAVPAA